MSRDPRYLDFRRLVEVAVVVTQKRFLLRPSEETNDLFVGVVGYAQRKLDMEIISLTALSTDPRRLLPMFPVRSVTHVPGRSLRDRPGNAMRLNPGRDLGLQAKEIVFSALP